MLWFPSLRRLTELSDQVQDLKGDVAKLEVAYDALHDFVKSSMGRLYKVAGERHTSEVQPEDQPLPEDGSESGNVTPGRLLTARQHQIQQQILRRRAGLKQ